MNSELRMTNSGSSLKLGGSVHRVSAHSSFGFRHSFFIRISSFVISTATLVTLLFLPANALACATCYGASDSPLADGMNWGIITLLGFIGSVLVGIVFFFAYIIRRASRLEAAVHSQIQTDPHS